MIKIIKDSSLGKLLKQIHYKAFKKNNALLNFPDHIKDSDHSVYGYFLKDTLIGYLLLDKDYSFQLSSPTELYIKSLAVLPEYQTQGIGKKLLNFVLNKFPNNNFSLDVRENNEKAIGLYKKFGFKPFKGDKSEMLLKRKRDNSISMLLERTGIIAELMKYNLTSEAEELNIYFPSQEMVDFFEERTKEHIDRVKSNMGYIAKSYPSIAGKILQRGELHDQSKYGPNERDQYIWLTWWHKCDNENIHFEYPDGIDEKVRKATLHHIKNNRHHPQFHKSVEDMTNLDIIEMMCDHKAMSQELNDSLERYTNDVTLKKFKFNDTQIELIQNLLKLFVGIN